MKAVTAMATIQKRNNSYLISVSCGYDNTGKQIRRTMTYKPEPNMTAKQIEKEVQRQAVLFEEKCRSGNILNGSVKFAAFSEMWLDDHKRQLRPKTYSRYKAMLPRINAAIGHLRLDRIQPLHLRKFYDNLAESGVRADIKYKCNIDVAGYMKEHKLTGAEISRRSGLSSATVSSLKKGNNVTEKSAAAFAEYMGQRLDKLFTAVDADKTLSGKTVLHHHRLISSILGTAVEWGVIASNPCDRTQAPKAEKTEPRYLDEKQAAAMLELLDYEPFDFRIMIRVLLFTGLRRGELLGLEWQDIDFEKRLLNVRRSSLYLPEMGVYQDDTKNDSSDRIFKVSQTVIDDLRDFRVWQLEQRLKVGDRWHNTNRLFTNPEGKPLNPDTLSGWFSDFVKAHRDVLPYVSVHSLRHTNATLQIAAGVPITTVSMRLGHSNTATTGRIYAHAIKSADEAAAEAIDDILVPKSKKTG